MIDYTQGQSGKGVCILVRGSHSPPWLIFFSQLLLPLTTILDSVSLFNYLTRLHGRDLDSTKLHGLPTEITDLVSAPNEAQVIMSHHRENSVRGKLIGKKWIYLERNTLYRVGPYQERGWIISLANEWEDYSNYLGGGGDFQELDDHPHFDL